MYLNLAKGWVKHSMLALIVIVNYGCGHIQLSRSSSTYAVTTTACSQTIPCLQGSQSISGQG